MLNPLQHISIRPTVVKGWKLLFLILLLHGFLPAQPAQTLFESANAYYGQKQYEEAAKMYLLVLKKDKDNLHARYNLGNCYYHLKDFPAAILHYEKARKLVPEDKQIAHNIQLANQQLFEKTEFSKDFFVTKAVKNFITGTSANTWAIYWLLVFWICAVAWCVYFLFGKNAGKSIGQITLPFVLLLAYFVYHAYTEKNKTHFAIVMQAPSLLQESPVQSAAAKDTLKAGTKVELLDRDKGWMKVQLQNGKSGWIQQAQLESI